MGLVVQATPDTPLAPLSAASGGTEAEAAPAGAFATILATMAGAADDSKGTAATAVASGGLSLLEIPLLQPDSAPGDGEDPLAGAVAAAIALSIGPVAALAPSASQSDGTIAGEVAADLQVLETAGQALADPGIIDGAVSAGAPASGLSTGALADAADPVDDRHVGKNKGPDRDGLPPGLAVDDSNASVVRAVGNANSQKTRVEAASGTGSPGSEPQKAIPHASTQGIAHAADGSAVAALRDGGTAPALVPGSEAANGKEGPANEPQKATPHASAQGIVHAADGSAVAALGEEAVPAPRPVPHASAKGIEHAADNSAVAQLRPDVGPSPKPKPQASSEGVAHAASNSAVAPLTSTTDSASSPAPVAATAPVTPPEVPAPMSQVGRAVIERVEQGGGEARIQLNPVELGEVTIKVKIAGDQVQVAIHAERPEAAQVLRAHTVDLSSLLGGRGLDLADVFVGQGNGGGQDPAQGWPWQRRRAEHDGFGALLGIDEVAAVQHYNRLRAAYNPDGAHVYRV